MLRQRRRLHAAEVDLGEAGLSGSHGLALVRHPAVAGGTGRCYGRLDLPLADPASIGPIVTALAPLRGAAIHTSPLSRCRVVAEALAAAWGGQPRIDDRLAELDFGEWEGLAWDAVPRASLDLWAKDLLGFAPPGGEPGAALVARVAAFWHALAAPAVVVTHGGPLRVLTAMAAGRPVDLGRPAPAPGSITLVHRRGDFVALPE